MALDPEVAALLEAQRALPPRNSLTVEQTRERMRASARLGGEPPRVAHIEDSQIAGVPVRSYTQSEKAPIVAFFHGGRFFSGDLDTHDILCRHLALASGSRVIAVDYRLAPEHKFPAAIEDACKVVASLGSHVSVAGDSAGANVAAVVARIVPGVARQLLIYPMLDATCGQPSHRAFAEGYGPGSIDMQRGWREYLPNGHDLRDPLVSPVFAEEVSGLPPALVLTAEYDTLRDEGELYARRIGAQLTRYDGMIHGFVQMTGVVSAARRAIEECGAFLRAPSRAR